MESREAWLSWLQNPQPIDRPLGKVSLRQFPLMLRRRFSTLGKCAMGAVLPLLNEGEKIPSIFASRHGDTALTLSLLESMGRDEPMSPTGFSLAVHNAVSGLFSIARQDLHEVTSIAANEGLVVQTLLEAVGQLQDAERVLCVVYDVPLPDLYSRYSESEPFPYAIAMIISRSEGEPFNLGPCDALAKPIAELPNDLNTESLRFLRLLVGDSTVADTELNGVIWRIARA
ncbi:beta-ketoacyl synthase chain length factor [Marinobacterium sp. CAU 1594]|nr:beta-ketoacyl synthase chain length factor [Marinobacterium arenosum]